jgi:hypothetical protein
MLWESSAGKLANQLFLTRTVSTSIFPIGRRLPQTRFLNVAIGTIVTQKKRYTSVYRARLGEIIEKLMTRTRSLVQRQQHAKHHGCVRAVIEIEPNLPQELRIGQFKEPASYRAWVRFSNASIRSATPTDLPSRAPRPRRRDSGLSDGRLSDLHCPERGGLSLAVSCSLECAWQDALVIFLSLARATEGRLRGIGPHQEDAEPQDR